MSITDQDIITNKTESEGESYMERKASKRIQTNIDIDLYCNQKSYSGTIVEIEISDEIIKRATKCHANFSCLNDKETPKSSDRLAMCSVEHNIAKNMVFVNFNNDSSCIYNVPFGKDDRICKCPVRFEIYKRYKI